MQAAFDKMLAADDPAACGAPFAGIPFLAKDLGNGVRALPGHAGSAAVARRVPPAGEDSLIFERFRGAGLLPFGVTTVPAFGLSLTSEPADRPPATPGTRIFPPAGLPAARPVPSPRASWRWPTPPMPPDRSVFRRPVAGLSV